MAEQQASLSQQAYAQVVARAWADPAFKQELLTNPRAAIAAATGVSLPENVDIRVVESTESVIYVNLPPQPPEPALLQTAAGQPAPGHGAPGSMPFCVVPSGAPGHAAAGHAAPAATPPFCVMPSGAPGHATPAAAPPFCVMPAGAPGHAAPGYGAAPALPFCVMPAPAPGHAVPPVSSGFCVVAPSGGEPPPNP